MEPWSGIADADAHLGRAFPLPRAPLPLVRWVEVRPSGSGAEIEWNLDDTRAGAPGRLALYAGPEPPPEREWPVAPEAVNGFAVRTLPLDEAEPALRPAHELRWHRDGLHLRLTAQGPWERADLLAIADSVDA
ncbi:MAG TPA: hypothetical protein VHF89_03845 [Solirubrobacteraceae bacterium]|nr:hypothetical protein [Solirubrobacteraceae bacterium]